MFSELKLDTEHLFGFGVKLCWAISGNTNVQTTGYGDSVHTQHVKCAVWFSLRSSEPHQIYKLVVITRSLH